MTPIPVVSKDDDYLTLEVNGKKVTVETKNQLALMLDKLGMTATTSQVQSELIVPMPGVILEIKTKTGSNVKKGDPPLTLEAMKMENMIKAPSDVIIKSVEVTPGQSIEKNQVLVTFQ